MRTPTVGDLIACFGVTDEELETAFVEMQARDIYLDEWHKAGVWSGPEDMSEQGIEYREWKSNLPPLRW